MIHGTPREANSLSPVPSAARPSRTALRMLFSFTCHLQLPSRIRRLLDRVEEAMQVDRGVERRQAVLAGADRLGEQRVHLADVERIAAGKVGRDPREAIGNRQIAQLVAALRALHAAASRRAGTRRCR